MTHYSVRKYKRNPFISQTENMIFHSRAAARHDFPSNSMVQKHSSQSCHMACFLHGKQFGGSVVRSTLPETTPFYLSHHHLICWFDLDPVWSGVEKRILFVGSLCVKKYCLMTKLQTILQPKLQRKLKILPNSSLPKHSNKTDETQSLVGHTK